MLFLLLFAAVARADDEPPDCPVIWLAGQWQLHLGGPKPTIPQEALPKIEWNDTIALPGTTETNRKGPENPHSSTTGLTRRYRYDGPAWYSREVTIPEPWRGKRLTLTLERTKYSQVWFDGKPVGESPILCTPQEYVLGAGEPGKHRLVICIDNTRRPVPGEMHQMSDNTQGNWNGILGEIELRATDSVWIDDVQVYPNLAKKTARVVVRLGNATNKAGKGRIVRSYFVMDGPAFDVQWTPSGGQCEIELPHADPEKVAPWDEFRPQRYSIGFRLEAPGVEDFRGVSFGLREFRSGPGGFTINGRPTLLRGKHDGCVFPLTGHPPMDTEGWRQYLRRCKEYGINHIRFHSWTPPEAAFEAADQLGMYLQPELPFWGEYTEAIQAALMPEAERILKCYGNHPSFVMLSLGNECGGRREVMGKMVARLRELDPRRLYAQGSNNFLGDPRLALGDDYWTSFRVRNAAGEVGNVRGSFATVDGGNGHVQIGPAGTRHDYSRAVQGIPVPVIGHEVGQYTVYPNFREIPKYTGVMRPDNFVRFQKKLEAAGMGDQADAFFRASGKLAALCYREEIEAALRTPRFGGFQLLDLQDFPGQGTALVGVLDALMDSKDAVSAETWRQFCGPVVLLARFDKYCWTTDEQFTADVQVAHYGPQDLAKQTLVWRVADSSDREIAAGRFPTSDIKQGGVRTLGKIAVPLKAVSAPARLTLALKLQESEIATSYPLWVYPVGRTILSVSEGTTDKIVRPTTDGASIVVARSFDSKAKEALAAGKTVVVVQDGKRRLAHTVGGGFATDFWCWPMFRNTPGTMGILCDPRHVALASFPTEEHSNYQWFAIASAAQPVILDGLKAPPRPLVQVIDNLDRVHRLGLVFEAKVASGRLLFCGSDLVALAEEHPEARQLLHSLMAYAASPQFQPRTEIPIEQLDELLLCGGPIPGKATSSTNQGSDHTADKAVDGLVDTRWCASDKTLPQWWQIVFDQPRDVKAVEIVWERDAAGYRYLLEGTVDGQNWSILSDQQNNQVRGPHHLTIYAKKLHGVRISMTGLPDGPWASIREVRFFGPE